MQFSWLRGSVNVLSGPKLIASIFAAVAVVLSSAHHWLHFWELSLGLQLVVILIAVPIFTVCIWFLASKTREIREKIGRRRWLAFLFPAFILATALAIYLFSPPQVWHRLEVIPSAVAGQRSLQLVEIKIPGANVSFSQLTKPQGWQLRDQMLVASGGSPAPIQYSFLAPVDAPVIFTFLTAPESADVTLRVDGETLTASVADTVVGYKALQLRTDYRFGIPGALISLMIILIDLVCFFLILTLAWLIQEIDQIPQATPAPQHLSSTYRKDLLILVALAFLLHAVNFLSTPLMTASDTPGYLDGAVYWMQHYTLDGVPSLRGPGSTFLFLPVMLLFGRNPLGIKILLHLLAIGCVPLAYRLGWQLTKRPGFAFAAGMIAVFTPDLMLYSSFVMSDLPNAFFGLLFCTLLLSVLEMFSWTWLIAAMLAGSFSVLFRPENVASLIVGILFLFAKFVWEWKTSSSPSAPKFWRLGLAVLLAALPLLGWSLHNYTKNGFFGLTDYEGEALYDGWVYYGESSHVPISASQSAAVQELRALYAKQPKSAFAEDDNDAPTGMEMLGLLLQNGYTQKQALTLLGQAARDSISNNPGVTLKVLEIKIRKGLAPETIPFQHTFPLPGDKVYIEPSSSVYFDKDEFTFRPAVDLQRLINAGVEKWYDSLYGEWVWFSLSMLLLCLYRRPFFVFAPLIALVATRIFVPTIVGMSLWRYVIAGIVPLQIFGLLGLWSLMNFLVFLYKGRVGTAG